MMVRRRRRCLILLVALVAGFGVYVLTSTSVKEVHFVANLFVKVQSPLWEDHLKGRQVDVESQDSTQSFASVHDNEPDRTSAGSYSETTTRRYRAGVTSSTAHKTPPSHMQKPTDDFRHYKMVVGILSAKRDPPTVVRMAQELVARVAEGDYKFLAWISQSGAKEENVINSLRDLEFEVHVNDKIYPEVQTENIHITFNDSLQRMKWRTTHVLDYANLLELALQYSSEYILILEDDLKPAKYALDKAYQFATKQLHNRVDWGSLTLFGNRYRRTPLTRVTKDGSYGGCAMMIRKSIISKFIKFLRSDPYANPIDLLLPRYFEMNRLQIYERSPNLFQHISLHSSYQGNDQNQRRTERTRSKTFMYDEDNKTLASIPSKPDGYVGCFVDYDGPERRDLSGLYAYASDGTKYSKSSPNLCKAFCKEYMYYGLQNGEDCYCGNEFGMYGWAPESECNKPCQLQPSKMCGGKFRNSVYRKPLYLNPHSIKPHSINPHSTNPHSANPHSINPHSTNPHS